MEPVTITALDDTYPLSEACLALEGITLAVGAAESCAYTVTLSDLDTYTNTITVSAEDNEGNNAHAEDTATVDVLGLAVEKQASADQIHAGDTVTYTYDVSNPSSAPLTIDSISDDRCAPVTFVDGDVDNDGLLNSQETWQYRCATTIAESTTNEVTVTAHDANATTVEAQDRDFVKVISPEIVVTAEGPTYAHEGDVLTYTVTVTNTGNTPLDTEVLLPDGGIWEMDNLAAGESATFETTHTAGTDDLITAFKATGIDALNGHVSDEDNVETQILKPSIVVDVTTDKDEIYPGDDVIVTCIATNTGNTLLYDVTITTDNGTPGTTSDDETLCVIDELGVGESATCETLKFPEETKTYTGDAQGHDILDGIASDEDAATVETLSDEIPNDEEGSGDTDGDGTPDYADNDDDGDGIPDAVEGTDDTDGDGTPNFLDDDSDGDGIPDAVEGADDVDGDGTPNFLDDDSDGDGIPDAIEGADDADGDGTPNFLDDDSDGDGIPDAIEGADDADGDGTPNFLDDDSDGDGIPDAIEGADDADGDGTPNFLDDDSDGDGIPDAIEGADDADGDGIPNFLDDDSDGDGIPDAVEGANDTDSDGIPNFLDTDADGDGLTDQQEWSTGPNDALAGCSVEDPVCYNNDIDGDGIPNFLDTDADGDGLSDTEEGLKDSDGDGIPDWIAPVITPSTTKYYVFLPLISNQD
jgi:hypothetical protein